MNTTTNLKKWWEQFPTNLRTITFCRFLASIGAGGVLYLTPLVFNELSFTASEIAKGFFVAAIAGTITRFCAGIFLDRGIKVSIPLKAAALLAIAADLFLLFAQSQSIYIIGEIFLGAAAGAYWPSVELAVPISCNGINSNKGFALARSADALGVSLGALIGSISATFGYIRLIYLVEIVCMLLLLIILGNNIFYKFPNQTAKRKELSTNFKEKLNLIRLLSPILIISLVCTGILSLLQIALQLDLVNGSINRPEMKTSSAGLLIAYQLALLVIFQWPVGNWLTQKNPSFGLKLSLYNLGVGCLLISLSSYLINGIVMVFIALIPISIGIASFLPTATESIVQTSPNKFKGLSMAIYSQCFGISFLIVPVMAGYLMDQQGNGMLLWLLTSFFCFLVAPLINKIKTSALN